MKAFKMENRRGSSVLEMLACIAVILILASLLVSSIMAALEKKRMAVCINNLKNLSAAMIMFANDNEKLPTELAYRTIQDKIPAGSASAWADIADYYSNQMGITQCPNVRQEGYISYGINQLIRGVNYHKIQHPSRIISVVESKNVSTIGTVTETDFRHMNRGLAGYVDGHVELIRFADLEDALQNYYNSPVESTGQGIVQKPNFFEDEVPPEADVPFTFTSNSVCSNGFRWDFGGLTDNGNGTKTFTFTITNSNNRGFSDGAFGLPAGVVPVSPSNGATYVGSRASYSIANPTNNPFYSIKFNSIGSGYKNGLSEVFSFTLSSSDADQVTSMRVYAKAALIKGQGIYSEGPPGTGDGGCT